MSAPVTDLLAARIREHRSAAGLSLSELARRAGLSKTILARIERGEGNPSVETLWRVSQALEVPLGALLAEAPPRAKPRVTRAGAGAPLRAASGMAAWLVHAERTRRRSDLYELRFDAGAEQRSEPHLPGTEEVVLCIEGALAAGPEGEEAELAAGDSVWFPADVAHAYRARTDTRALNVMLYGPSSS